jgi:ubiquinone/menaquinone biosynthesis C-methylase UbiE
MLQIVGEALAEAVNLHAGERVLDVAAGNGNATLAGGTALRGRPATDYVEHLLEKAAARAHADGLTAAFRVADVEALPFEEGAFDVALSTFGVMFTPDHERAAAELLRVVRPGGRIGLAAWTPEGFIGELFRIVGAHLPPPAGVRSPARWGEEPYRVELFVRQATGIRCTRRSVNFRYRSPEHWIDLSRSYYGPHKAFAALDSLGQRQLHAELERLLASRNVSGPDSRVILGEYLEAVITR